MNKFSLTLDLFQRYVLLDPKVPLNFILVLLLNDIDYAVKIVRFETLRQLLVNIKVVE